MAADALVRCRVSSETKTVLQSIAAREQITESALVRQLLETLARTSATEMPTIDKPDSTELRRAHVDPSSPRRPGAAERSSQLARNALRTYVAVLVRSHLRKLTPLPVEELAALKRSIAELGAVGRNLNQIARALDAGGRSNGPGRQDLEAMLKIAVALRDHVRALLKANETSWERGYAETTD